MYTLIIEQQLEDFLEGMTGEEASSEVVRFANETIRQGSPPVVLRLDYVNVRTGLQASAYAKWDGSRLVKMVC